MSGLRGSEVWRIWGRMCFVMGGSAMRRRFGRWQGVWGLRVCCGRGRGRGRVGGRRGVLLFKTAGRLGWIKVYIWSRDVGVETFESSYFGSSGKQGGAYMVPEHYGSRALWFASIILKLQEKVEPMKMVLHLSTTVQIPRRDSRSKDNRHSHHNNSNNRIRHTPRRLPHRFNQPL